MDREKFIERARLYVLEVNGEMVNLGDEIAQRDAEIERLRAAVHGVAPWLAASLTDHKHDGKGEYEKACNAVLAVDTP